ncbi:HNH endonuclease [Marinicauda pacifica]|uniref:HNH endonuclease n=1 Tax=Marinicauda pacifica TaxID=1133559 RepID=UPI00130521C7|nr:HNH endonuclease [Marinicauda pacifica]
MQSELRRADILRAFEQFDGGVRPERFGTSVNWTVLHPVSGEPYPAKAIFALATGQSNKDINTRPARRTLAALGFELLKFEEPYKANAEGGWSEAELVAAAEIYANRWEAWRRGDSVNKAAYRREALAGALAARSQSSFERCMQNIAAIVTEDFGLPKLPGYQPLGKVGAGTRVTLAQAFAEALGLHDDDETFSVRVAHAQAALLDQPSGPPPLGRKAPIRSTRQAETFVRDARVAAWVLHQANGRCEGCASLAPFTRPNGSPYLEIHHIHRLADDGPDMVDNTVALCPNCHRRAHFGEHAEHFAAALKTVAVKRAESTR